jgi:hypothetical protein
MTWAGKRCFAQMNLNGTMSELMYTPNDPSVPAMTLADR